MVFEILSSEEAYVDSLQVCIDLYLKPMQNAVAAQKPILQEGKLKIIFMGLESIVSVNTNFLEPLKQRLKQWHPNLCVGDIFQKIESFLEQYTQYIKNYTESVRLLKREQRKNKVFKEFCQKQKMEPRAKQRELEQFLIMPVQRIPRYNLLLRELLKHTWKDHPDFDALDGAVEKLANIAMYLNERKREAEALQRTFHVQEILDSANVNVRVSDEERKYLFEGELYDSNGKPVVVYLFSDLIIICGDKNDRAHTEADERRDNRKKIKFSELLLFDSDMVVVDIVDVDSSGKPAFVIDLPSQKKSLQLRAQTASIKKEWMDMIRSVQAKLSSLALVVEPKITGSPMLGAMSARRRKRTSVRHVRQRSNDGSSPVVEHVNPLHKHVRDSGSNATGSSSAGSNGSGSNTMIHSSNSAPSIPPLTTPAEKEKKRFFPLPSPRSERKTSNEEEAAENGMPSPSRSKGTVGRKGRFAAFSTAIPNNSDGDEISGSDTDEIRKSSNDIPGKGAKQGSVRKGVAAVMRLTNLNKLFDKDEKEEKDKDDPAAPKKERRSSETSSDEKDDLRSARGTNSDMQKLQKLMVKKHSVAKQEDDDGKTSKNPKLTRSSSNSTLSEKAGNTLALNGGDIVRSKSSEPLNEYIAGLKEEKSSSGLKEDEKDVVDEETN